MLLVSFTYLGEMVKVEVIGNNIEGNKINENEYLKRLLGKDPSILNKRDLIYNETYEWCLANNDFLDDKITRQSNFVFK